MAGLTLVAASLALSIPDVGSARDAVEEPFRAVVIHVEAGNVDVVADRRRTGALVWQWLGPWWAPPRYESHVQDGVLYLDAECRVRLASGCSAHVRVAVPPDAPVTVRAGSGDVSVAGLSAALDVEGSGGWIRLRSLRGGTVRAVADVGDVTVSTWVPPDRLHASTRRGSVLVQLPSDSYDIRALAPGGALSVEVPRSDRSGSVIDVSSAEGDVTVEDIASPGATVSGAAHP